jgi:hypothetical protein
MGQIFLVIKYDSALPHGRETVGVLETEGEASRFAPSLPDEDVRVLSRKPDVFKPSVEHIHRLCDRTFRDLPSPEKVEGGLQCSGEFWPFDRSGSGIDGRAMPGDIRLWARVAQHRVAMAGRDD